MGRKQRLAARQTSDQQDELVYKSKSKRPFCNAFTGCGKKRSGEGSVLVDKNGDPRPEDPLFQLLNDAQHWQEFLRRMQLAKSGDLGASYYRRKRDVATQVDNELATGKH